MPWTHESVPVQCTMTERTVAVRAISGDCKQLSGSVAYGISDSADDGLTYGARRYIGEIHRSHE